MSREQFSRWKKNDSFSTALLILDRHLDARFGWICATGICGKGASTISQQLARSIFLDVQSHLARRKSNGSGSRRSIWNFAIPKPQLLEMYLNQV